MFFGRAAHDSLGVPVARGAMFALSEVQVDAEPEKVA